MFYCISPLAFYSGTHFFSQYFFVVIWCHLCHLGIKIIIYLNYFFHFFVQVLNQTGNEDLCYYNFLCAHPLGLLSGNCAPHLFRHLSVTL
jgi:hypothetical protein